ncbi:hypothetical protein THIOM_001924 [Candidatus Thiomargarita nelsonii]|uniref:Uncharacterized protein n=1 Tax=Candidatus Thiomargarita nelsonii TaxID=1003181 RepID=A0A176S2G6_9GAMM|nr:hypothetical protein THIOM_001924 [Candidatus Thiomargarita nelsonii]
MLASTEKLQEAGFASRVFTERDLARVFGGTPDRASGDQWTSVFHGKTFECIG